MPRLGRAGNLPSVEEDVRTDAGEEPELEAADEPTPELEVSHDRRTMFDHFRAHLMAGKPSPGLLIASQGAAIGQVVETIVYVWALADAHEAAVAGNDLRLHDIIIEAMRFDPLALGLPRIALTDWTIARGTRRATTIPKGATVLVKAATARISAPCFRAGRSATSYCPTDAGKSSTVPCPAISSACRAA